MIGTGEYTQKVVPVQSGLSFVTGFYNCTFAVASLYMHANVALCHYPSMPLNLTYNYTQSSLSIKLVGRL